MKMKMLVLTASAVGAGFVASGAGLTSQSYVQDGLLTQFDAIENVGVGQHEAAPGVWKDLKGSASITLPSSGPSWSGRALDAGRNTLTMAGMPAFYLDSVSSEVTLDRIENGPANNYPRIIHHMGSDGLYSVYLNGTGSQPQFFIGESSTRPLFNYFSSATLGMASDTTNYRTYHSGSAYHTSNGTVMDHKEAPASDWQLNRQAGYLHGRYYAFRHYNRALTAAEFAANALIDKFRFFSFTVTGAGAETPVAWANLGWAAPYGRTETAPLANTNDFAQIINATVSVAATDDVALKGLSLEDGAKLVLAAGTTARVQILYVEGRPVARGVYTGAEGTLGTVVDWISGAGQVSVAGDGNTKFPQTVRGFGSYSYVQSGLVTQFDAIDNVGAGVHDAAATVWQDLVRSASLTLSSGTEWNQGRYFKKTCENEVYIGPMPAYVRNSVTCEVPINIYECGGSGQYPRIFANGNNFCIYFPPWNTTLATVFLDGQDPDARPSLGYFRKGTIAAFSGTYSYGGAVDGSVIARTGDPVKSGLSKGSDTWGLGMWGMLKGAYGGLRFYSRELTEAEFAWNALVDKFRFFSYAYANGGEEVNWADIAWNVPEGQTADAPSAETNKYVTVSRAQVSVAATDEVALMGLSLENGATLKVAAGAVVSAKLIYVNGKAVDHGIYSGEGGEGTVVDWISGAGQVRVAGAKNRTIPSIIPVADADGWYTFGLSDGSNGTMSIKGERPDWDVYGFPVGAKLRLRGWILLDTVPDVFADYDTTQLTCAYVSGTRAYAANRPFDVPAGAVFRFMPGSWSCTADNTYEASSLDYTQMSQTTGDVALQDNASFHVWGDSSPNLTYGGLLSGSGILACTSYGRQMRFTGGFACNASGATTWGNQWQNGAGIWVDTLAVTSTLQTVTLSSCSDVHGMSSLYSASFVMFGKNGSKATADHALNIDRLNGNALSRVDDNGKRWRSGGHVLVWGSNTVHVGTLKDGLHVVADRRDQDCNNGFLNSGAYTSKGIGFLSVDAFDSGTIYGSTNVALTVGTVAANTGFDYTYQSDAVNSLMLDITGSCASSTTLKATDLAMLPARVSGFKGSVSLTDTEARSYEMPIDLTAGPDALSNTVGCNGSGTLVAAPETSSINVTFPTTGIDPKPGKYAIARFSAGGELLNGWTVTLNGEPVSETTVNGHSIRLVRNAKGIFLGVDLPGLAILVR